mmetsp:Transcript_14217/g.28812  ORF Transcript_14217/g.28812 Transcript_14217/m.28812 type:complete len:217 (-) Transcript_14217:286-936(-)
MSTGSIRLTSSRWSPQSRPAACRNTTPCTPRASATSRVLTWPSPVSWVSRSSCSGSLPASRPSSRVSTSKPTLSARVSSPRPRAAARRCRCPLRRHRRLGRLCSSGSTPRSSPRTQGSALPMACSTVSSPLAITWGPCSRRGGARGATPPRRRASPTSSTSRAATACPRLACRRRSSTRWCAPAWSSASAATFCAWATRAPSPRSARSQRRASRWR